MKRNGIILVFFCMVAGMAMAGEVSVSAMLQQSSGRIHRFTMENGIVGLVKPDESAPVVAIQIWFGTGSIHEGEFLGAGMSHVVEHMIFKGTPSRTMGDITRELDSAGGRVNAYTTLDRTVFHTVIPSANWKTGLEVLSDAVRNASFPEEEWEKERQVIFREMAMNDDDPARVVGRLLWSTAFRVHPVRHPVIGYREVFGRITRDDIVRFFEQHYRPDNMIFALAGDVDPLEAEREIRAAFKGFERRARPPVVLPAEPPQLAPRFARKTGDYELTRAAWGVHTVPLHHPDAPALDVLAVIVGQGESSRLNLELRDQLELVHEIRAWSYTPAEPGLFGISATLDSDREEAAIEGVDRAVARWSEEPFTEEEVARARRRVLTASLHELQTMRGQANTIASGEFYAADPRFSERYLAQIEAVTPEHVQMVYERYLRPENRTLALLTPGQPGEEKPDVQGGTSGASVRRIELPNGIPLIVREDTRLPLAFVSVALLAGTLSESDETHGVTQFMAELLPRGTAMRSAQEIAREVDALGATLKPFSGLNSFGMEAMCLVDDLDAMLSLIAECLLHPVFPEEEIRRQRMRQLAEIRAQGESPFQIADQMVRDHLYPGHPYRQTPAGRIETVERIGREELVRHLKTHLASGNIAISVFGGVCADDVYAAVSRLFAGVPEGERVHYTPPIGVRDLPVRVERREPRQQTILLKAFPGVNLADERLPALEVVQSALSGLSSELGMEVRDRRGLVYFVGAFQRTGLAPGRFVLYAGTEEASVPEIEELMEAELRRIRTEGLSDEELERAKAQLAGDHHALLQNNARLAQESALNELYGLGYRHAFARDQRIAAVTHEQVRAVAAEILDASHRVIAVVYPQSQP